MRFLFRCDGACSGAAMSTLAYGLNYLSTSWADLGRPTVTLILSCRMLGTVRYAPQSRSSSLAGCKVRTVAVRGYGTVRYVTVRYGTAPPGPPNSHAHPLLQDVRYGTGTKG
jgi:hypothetical protein